MYAVSIDGTGLSKWALHIEWMAMRYLSCAEYAHELGKVLKMFGEVAKHEFIQQFDWIVSIFK